MSDSTYIIVAFVLYLGAMMAIGVLYYKKTSNMSDYILGNRQLGAWIISLSAEASDMSGWMLMGLPGYAYVAGFNAGWIGLGLAIGTLLNWQFVASRLRNYTELANNSLTLPDFFPESLQRQQQLSTGYPGNIYPYFFCDIHIFRICSRRKTF